MAAFARPDRYFEFDEPFHYAWLKWSWDPARSLPEDMLHTWAEGRFPGAPDAAARAFRQLCSVKENLLYPTTIVTGGVRGMEVLLTPTTFHPELSMEDERLRRTEGPWLGRQDPRSRPRPGPNVYFWEKRLRDAGFSEKTLHLWIKRIDTTRAIDTAVASWQEVVDAHPGYWPAQHGMRRLKGVQARLHSKKENDEAVLRWALATEHGTRRPAGKRAVQLRRALQCMRRAVQYGLAVIFAPQHCAISWSRWMDPNEPEVEHLRPTWDTIARGIEAETFDEVVAGALRRQARTTQIYGHEPWRSARFDAKRFALLDISRDTNRRYSDAWNDWNPLWIEEDEPHYRSQAWDLNAFPRGMHHFYGVPAQLGGPAETGDYVVLGCRDRPGTAWPESTGRIAVGSKVKNIHFFWSTMWWELRGVEVASVEVRYRDGRTEQFPVRYEHEVENVRRCANNGDARVAWTNFSPKKGRRLGSMLMYSWPNPRPGRAIDSVRIKSAGARAALMLFAISAER